VDKNKKPCGFKVLQNYKKMLLNKKQSKLLFSEIFDETDLITVEGITAQNQFIEQFLPTAKALGKGIEASISTYSTDRKAGTFKRIALIIHNPYVRDYNWCYIEFNNNKLSFSNHYAHGYFKNIEKLKLFIAKLHEKFDEENNKKIKKEKINKLKANAVVASIQTMAEEEGFEYSFTYDKTKINLLVRLSKTNALNIYIPYGKFQEVLQKVRDTIKTIRNLHDSGIIFKIQGASRVRWIQSGEPIDNIIINGGDDDA